MNFKNLEQKLDNMSERRFYSLISCLLFGGMSIAFIDAVFFPNKQFTFGMIGIMIMIIGLFLFMFRTCNIIGDVLKK